MKYNEPVSDSHIVKEPLSKEHLNIVKRWLQADELPNKGNILVPCTGGAETTLIQYMLAKYYEDNNNVNIYGYTLNVFEPPAELHTQMEDEYNPFMNAYEGSALLYRIMEKTTKKINHIVRYFTVDEVLAVKREKNYDRIFNVPRDFDIPMAEDLVEKLNCSVWYTGRNKMYTTEQIRNTVLHLEQDHNGLKSADTHLFNKIDIPVVTQRDGYKVIRPFLELQKHEVFKIYEELDILDLLKKTVSCPHINPGTGCHGNCQYMLSLKDKTWKSNCFERLTAETLYGISKKCTPEEFKKEYGISADWHKD